MSSAPKKKNLFQYSFMALPLAFAGLPLYVHIPDFYTRDLGMNIGLIGAILLFIRLFDAIQDPVIGYVSDRFYMRRYAIMVGGAAAMSIGIAAIFYGPHLSVPIAAWFAISMMLATTGFSVLAINLNMIGGFWSDDSAQRTRISAWREALGLAGLLIASVLPAALITVMPAEQSFRTIFWIFAAFMVSGFLLFSAFMKHLAAEDNALVKKKKSDKNVKQRFSFWKILAGKDKHFFGVCILTHLAASMPAVLVMFFIRDYLKAEEDAGIFLFLYFLSGACLMGIWVKLAGKIGKERAWLASMVLAIVTFMWAYFLQEGDVVAFGIICVLSGVALGADLALPPSILADRVNHHNNEADATQYFALVSVIPKIMLAAATGISLLILDYLGFAAGTENDPKSLAGLIALYALVPCLIKICAAVYLWWMYKHEGDLNDKTERDNPDGTFNIS